MARNKSERNVGQPARSALKELSDALKSIAPPQGRQPGEFTVYDAAADWGMTAKGADTRLRALERKGQLVRRVGRENSKVVAFYRKP